MMIAGVGEPVASGLVAALRQPGGNTTGFANLEVELLSEIA